MVKKDHQPTPPGNGEPTPKVSFWDALVAEGFVPVRVPRRVIVREGHPDVPVTRYRPGQRAKE